MPLTPPVVLTIAGFDPSSGAGVTADIKTIAAQGCYGVACITALTVQSTGGVRRTMAVDPALVGETLEELARDVSFEAIHIGMLANAAVAATVAEFLDRIRGKEARPPNIVLDPVLKSSSGAIGFVIGRPQFSNALSTTAMIATMPMPIESTIGIGDRGSG